jgi:hypothetical protein
MFIKTKVEKGNLHLDTLVDRMIIASQAEHAKNKEIENRETPEIESYISLAVKEGYLDADEAEQMNAKQKRAYYEKGQGIDLSDNL